MIGKEREGEEREGKGRRKRVAEFLLALSRADIEESNNSSH